MVVPDTLTMPTVTSLPRSSWSVGSQSWFRADQSHIHLYGARGGRTAESNAIPIRRRSSTYSDPHPDASTTTFQYDFAGRPVSRTTPRGTVSYAYDAATGQIASVSAPGGVALSYAYDGGLLTTSSMSGPVSETITRTYDNDFRLTSIAFGGATTTLTYDADNALTNAGSLTLNRNAQNGLLIGSTLGNTTDAWTYDGFARPTQYRAAYLNTALFVQQYTRDTRERIVGLTETIGGERTSMRTTMTRRGAS